LVYKKYIYKKGKKFGPYYFKSVRNPDGAVSSIYLGKKNPSSFRGSLMFIIITVLFFSFIGYFSYNAFIVADVSEDSHLEELSLPEEKSLSDETISSSDETINEPEIVVEELIPEEEIDDSFDEVFVEENVTVEKINISEIDVETENNGSLINISQDFDGSINLSEINESDIEVNNSGNFEDIVSDELDNFSTNISETVNITELDNLSLNYSDNLSDHNLTVFNVSINQSFEEVNYSILSNYTVVESYNDVIINSDVKWTKHISLENPVNGFEVELPVEAENVEVIEESYFDEKPSNVELSKGMDFITGGVVFNFNSIGSKILNFIKNLFKFTGFAILDEDNNIIVLDSIVKEAKIEYYMPGPNATEIYLGEGVKQVILASDINYTNITVYSYFDDVKENSISIYDSKGNKVSYESFDLNNNGFTDYIEWVSLEANETYNLSLVILNFQSFPVVGKNWTVMFNTTGRADLRVYPINGTTWGDDPHDNDLRFLEIKCGDEILDTEWDNGSIVVYNYSCDSNGYESSYVRTSGGHYLEFDFGGVKAQARNSAVCGDVLNADNTLTGDLINCAGGYALALQYGKGNYTLDCAGFKIDCAYGGTTDGIYIQNAVNVTIKNCTITECEYGLLSYGDAKNVTVTNTTSYNNTAYGIMLYDTTPGLEDNKILDSHFYLNGQRGIYLYGAYNTNVSNNDVYKNTLAGVYLYIGSNNTFYNNSVRNNSDYGFRLNNAWNQTIVSNSIYGNNDQNIYLQGNSSYNMIKDNEIYASETDQGVYFAGTTMSYNSIINNTIYNNYDEGVVVGQWGTLAGTGNRIENNTVFNHSLQRGVFVTAPNVTVIGNNFYNNKYDGIYFYVGSTFLNISNNQIHDNIDNAMSLVSCLNATIVGNNLSSNPDYGLYFISTNYSYLANNTIYNNWQTTSYGGATTLVGGHDNLFENNQFIRGGDFLVRTYTSFENNTFRYNLFSNSTDNLIYLGDSTSSNNNKFYGDVFERNSSDSGLYLGNANNTQLVNVKFSGPGNNIENSNSYGNYTTLLNVTWDSASFSGTHIYYRKWYLDINVTNSSNDGLENANISIYNNGDSFSFNELTNSSGWITRKNLTEYSVYGSSYTYFTNYTINTTSPSSSYSNDSQELNLTTNKAVNVILGDLNFAPDMVSARISPETPVASDNLLGYCNASDVDGDELLYYWGWYLNGTLNQSGSSSIGWWDDMEDGFDYSGAGLDFHNQVVDENWETAGRASGIASTGGDYWVNYTIPEGVYSALIQYKYAAEAGCNPVYVNKLRCYDGSSWAEIDSWDPGESGNETAVVPSSCLDNLDGNLRLDVYMGCAVGKTSSYFYEEKVFWNQTAFSQGQEINLNNLSSIYTNKGDNWTFACLANDATQNASDWINTSVVIGNVAPTTISARIGQGVTTYTNETLVGYCNGSDSDSSDTLTYYWQWYLNGSLDSEGIVSTILKDDSEDGFSYTDTPFDPENAVDEDWDTYAGYSPLDGASSFFINYTIPANVTTANSEIALSGKLCERTSGLYCYNSSGWELIESWSFSGSHGLANYTNQLSEGCLDNPDGVLQLYFSMDCGDDYTDIFKFYEEQVYWNTGTTYYPNGQEVNVNNLTSGNTNKHDNWTFACLANDGSENASLWKNYSTYILNSPPTAPSLGYPASGGHVTDRPAYFWWYSSQDADDDSREYHFVLDLDSSFDPVEYNRSPPENGVGSGSLYPNYTETTDVLYYWKVRAYDGEDFGAWSEIRNFTVDSLVDIILNNSQVDFGSLGPGDIVNTTNDSYSPFIIENNGNVLSNISINATSLFSSVALDSMYYQFKVDNYSGEENSFNETFSLIDWTNMPSESLVFLGYLNYSNVFDNALIDILVRIPGYEPEGNKLSNVTFTGEIAE